MKILLGSIFLGNCVLNAQELAPVTEIVTEPSSNSSSVTSLVFPTQGGVGYQVFRSSDLTQWTESDWIYGMGQNVQIPLMTIASGGGPPLAVVNDGRERVAVWLTPVSGSLGSYYLG